MQESIQQWIQLEEEIQRKQRDLYILRKESSQLEQKIYDYVKTNQMINKQVKTTSGKKFIFRERTQFQPITHKFLREVLDKFFHTLPIKAQQLYDYILQQRMSKKYFEIEKK